MNFKDFKDLYQKKEVQEYPNEVSQKPLISVCVQTFQHEDYIKDCLDSLLNQKTSFEYEILLGEDKSNDNTREICISYAERYPDKIRLFLHEPQNKIFVLGQATGNFNAFYNFFSARGEYIAFCEGDDFWGDKFKLQKQAEFLNKNPNYVFTYHSYQWVDQNKQPLLGRKEDRQPKIDLHSKILKSGKHQPLLVTICFRKSPLQPIPREIIEVINVDTFLMSLLGQYGHAKFQASIQPSFSRMHPNGIWSGKKREKKILSKLLTYKYLIRYFERRDKKLARKFRKISKKYKKILINYYLKKGEIISAVKILKDYFPFNLKSRA